MSKAIEKKTGFLSLLSKMYMNCKMLVVKGKAGNSKKFAIILQFKVRIALACLFFFSVQLWPFTKSILLGLKAASN